MDDITTPRTSMTASSGPQPSFAVTGLGAMGSALARNLASTGRRVVVHNRTTSRTDELVDRHGDEGLVGVTELREMVGSLDRPRVVICMVATGSPVDEIIDALGGLLERGDVIIDAGNSDFRDTERRAAGLRGTGLGFLGLGVSGGEQGALDGPSLMPGGDRWAYDLVEPTLTAIAADVDGEPCCTYIGQGGSGHFVKMVHNGIEYADMAGIAEAVEMLRRDGRRPDELAAIIDHWNEGDLGSFLMEITSRILRVRDEFDAESFLIDRVADRASQKGTGRLMAHEALELGEPATTVAEAVAHRSLSSLDERRRSVIAVHAAHRPDRSVPTDLDPEDVAAALLGTRIVGLAQGFDLLDAAGRQHGWPLDLAAIARVWRDGCIIRSRLLGDVEAAISDGSPHLMLDDRLAGRLAGVDPGWRRTIGAAVSAAVPVPVMMSALAWLDAFRSERLPTALIQAQRDLFGAHTYERTDRSGSFHSAWSPG